MAISFFEEGAYAGFPSPAADYLEKKLDLNDYLIKRPAATFFVRVSGDSMIQAGIHPQDILIVDRAEPVKSGKIVVALYNGAFTVKRFVNQGVSQGEKIVLYPANPKYPPIQVNEGDDFQIWGVVTYVIHKAV